MTDSLSDSDVEQVVRLVETLDGSSFDYLELQVGDMKVTIGKGEPPSVGSAPAAPVTTPAPQVLPAAPAPTPLDAVAPVVAPTAGAVEITAPTMGIFYAQSEPGKPPFVTVGALVEEDTTVALVEVMKTFHAVSAGVRGTVVEVCVQDAQLVEFGQVMYRVEPALR
ncbi:acetyl-CoA carboxylase biotin carboxyl carrier protein [Pseudonocardia sp. CA-142604]|uniref:acetyl-CoA carboxylase biotin carboxyl carrier protein n=1 Tax=Pseudonocardia sp. CA-142604 TaxID=3240024 RepID=UPI003D93183E